MSDLRWHQDPDRQHPPAPWVRPADQPRYPVSEHVQDAWLLTYTHTQSL